MRLFIPIVVFYICSSLSIFGQDFKYNFRSLKTADGLSQNSVIKIQQDRLGQLWIATRDGLNKYDGTNFIVYRNNSRDSTSISNNDILSIKEDLSGNIWVGTYNGLNRYNPIDKTFKRYFHNNSKNSLTDNTIWALEEVNDEIWIGTTNGLTIYNKKTKLFTKIFHQYNNEETIASNFVLDILKTEDGSIWLGTSKGLCKFVSRKNNQFVFQRIKYSNSTIENALYIQDLEQDNFNNLWIATKNSGLFKINFFNDTLTLLNQGEAYDYLDKDIRTMSFDNENNLWLGTYNGVAILSSNGILRDVKSRLNLSKVKSIFTDAKGSIWIGTYYGGLNIWDKIHNNFNNFNQEIGGKEPSYNVVSAIVTDKNKNIYFGTEGSGVTIYNSLTQNISYVNNSSFNLSLSDNIKSMMLMDDKLYIGTYKAGISIYDIKSKKIDNNSIPSNLKNILKQYGIYAIKQEKESVIWFGTFGNGLVRYDLINKKITQFKRNSKDINSISSNLIRSILIDTKKRIWVATQSGLNCFNTNSYNKDSLKIKRFFYDTETISGADILTIFEDSNQNIWVGTKANGLFRYNENVFEKIELIKGDLKIETIHAILEDSNNNLWLSSNYGIVNLNLQKNDITIYDQADGLKSEDFNNNACAKLDNQFYFGSPAGVSYFMPDSIATNTYSPQVILTDFKIKNKSIKVNDEDNILTKSITYSKNIVLSYDNANFSIKFAIPNLINPTKNKYSYRMLGLDDQWIETLNNEAFYTIQNSGTYIFEVKGANNDGIWNSKETSIEIIVNPAPWNSWWAYLLYTLLTILALLVFIQFLKSKEKLKHELEFEHLEGLRIEESTKAKMRFFTNISHEFRTPLTLILGPLQNLLEDYQGSSKMYKKLLVIQNNANHLLKLINKLMDFRKLENDQLKLQAKKGNIIDFLKEIYLSFSEYAKQENYNYSLECLYEELLVYYDSTKLEHVFYNIISNAFRYTPKGGTIAINIFKKKNNVLITIKDSGIGISEDHLDKIFNRFFEIPMDNEPHKNYNKASGIGLSITKDIITQHKWNIEVESKLEEGTTFTITLPLGKDHLAENEIISDDIVGDDISLYKSQLKSVQASLDSQIDNLYIKKENKEHILIVEDNKALRLFLRELLKEDYNIIEADNGKTALKKALKYIPDLIISDVVMPEMAGTELCSKIKENLKISHIPVILLTARTSLIYKYEGLESGADDYISKPFNLKEFKLKIKNLLDSTQRLKNKFVKDDYLRPSDITVSSLDEELLKKALDIVETNISNELFDITFFCAELGVSRTMLFTKIKAWTNFTPNEFIHEMRLKRAAQLLEQGTTYISQISYKVGFKNPKYFSKCFQKKYGLSPTKFRAKFRN